MEIDEITLARRTIALLSSMVEGGEVHTSRTKEMVDNSLKALKQLKNHGDIGDVVVPKGTVCQHPFNKVKKMTSKVHHCLECDKFI